jgi:hypothetical protein
MFATQYPADFEQMSAKYMPFPNIYPVEGASGGAIFNPSDNIPTKFVILEPCHNNFLFSNYLNGKNLIFSFFLSTS